jgi:glutathione S-transferase
MAEYVLYCFAQSGNAYKPALALELANADWEPRFVDYFGGGTRTPEYRAINLMGEVPVLLHNGLTLSQSGVILDYLAETRQRCGSCGRSRRLPTRRCCVSCVAAPKRRGACSIRILRGGGSSSAIG